MTNPINESPVAGGAEGDVGTTDISAGEPKINPAWNPLLEKIPDQNLQKMIIPTLQEWDKNHQQGIQKVHSTYEPYKPFLDAQIAPEDLNNAMMVYQALQENPEDTIRALLEWSGYEAPGEQGQENDLGEDDPEYDAGEDGDIPFDPMQHPEIQRNIQMTQLMAKQLLAENQERLQAQEDADLDQELAAAREKHGDFDEDMVLPIMHAYDLSADEAVTKYKEHLHQQITNYRSPGSKAPILSGGGGGLPSQQTPVKGLSGQDRRKLIAETLARAQQGG